MKGFKKNIYRSDEDTSALCLNCIPNIVPIGTQRWTGCNATVATYRDNTLIPYVENAAAWAALTTGAWCYYQNDPTTEATYGKLYNWYAVNNTANGGIAPVGYKVPTDAEWTVLTDYLGGATLAGGKMKETGLCHWSNPNIDATNDSLFTGLPGGYRDYGGYYNNINNYGWWWSSTESSLGSAWYRRLNSGNATAHRGSGNATHGFSLRFIEDPTCPNCIAHDLPPIGTQVWTGCDANIKVYNNGDAIPQITNTALWGSTTTGAWCYYNNDPSTEAEYGILYNWYALDDTRGIAPSGYHVPTDAEWTTLTTFLGGESVAGGKMKEEGTCHWDSPNSGATNSSNFTAFGGGYRFGGGNFSVLGSKSGWWSSTEGSSTGAWSRSLFSNTGTVSRNNDGKTTGLKLRFIKN
jgi:uncharacterized protein (TIGR02145 family)